MQFLVLYFLNMDWSYHQKYNFSWNIKFYGSVHYFVLSSTYWDIGTSRRVGSVTGWRKWRHRPASAIHPPAKIQRNTYNNGRVKWTQTSTSVRRNVCTEIIYSLCTHKSVILSFAYVSNSLPGPNMGRILDINLKPFYWVKTSDFF